ncbi:unnamed protein product [Owenia fusiformis]|uniref:non-specific serine/threonine protein kinase n=1 Tax=Owenia fusiformis TaxID=6347 RepID=A0A8J1Y620_OWEFU|nr:unnamed protein product [Owenia fusiformis]
MSSDEEPKGGATLTPRSIRSRRKDAVSSRATEPSYDSDGSSIESVYDERYQGKEVVYVKDEATTLADVGGRLPSQSDEGTTPSRLLLVSSKIKNIGTIQNAIVSGVCFMSYKYESSNLESIMATLRQALNGQKVVSVALILHGSGTSINICGKDEKILTKDNTNDTNIREFFKWLVEVCIDKSNENARIDFLACQAGQGTEGTVMARELETYLGVPVGICKDICGTELHIGEEMEGRPNFAGDLYFRLEKLKNWTGNNQQTLAGFEKIRTVGKGAYGAAVLYKKKDDDSLVILKEVNMHDLNASERQMALNEWKVLAMLDHPNIISYYDSFEEDGTLMIEMEYADGGTLAQYLVRDKPMEEKEILSIFQQIVAALRHIHEHNILHRDLKTANIFMTKEGVVKVGDFGISKMMSTATKAANTVLGTPYYISPEMCEGKAYNEKSDIWASGCILYEMACLTKTFEGSNLPALVNKIMKGQFAPVKGNYSPEFKMLIRDMLQREPEYRPTASELMYQRLPELMNSYEDPTTDFDEDLMISIDGAHKKRRTRSVLYYLQTFNMQLHPIDLMHSKIKIREVAVGGDHVIVVTMERMVFTWGEGSKGQLGHGSLESSDMPQMVEALKGKSITKACCGDGFSVFASDNGIVMTCGDGTLGCLGHGDWCSTSRPRLIEALLSVDVVAVSCGPQHVVVVGSNGEIYSWGKGAHGRLGLGNEEDYCTPMEVTLSEPVFVREVRCGIDGTMFLTDVGSVLACGNNEYNKLGLNQRQGFLMAMKNIFNKTEVEGQKVPTVIKALTKHRVVDVSMGPKHCAVLVEPGHVYTFGRNNEGQLGTENTKPQNAPIEVKQGLESKTVQRVQCGELYTVVSTTDNELYFWGTRYKTPLPSGSNGTLESQKSIESGVSEGNEKKGHSRQASITSVNSLNSTKESLPSPSPTPVPANRDGSASNRHERTDKGDKGASSDSTLFSSADKIEKLNLSNSNSTDISSKYGFRPISSTPRRSQSAGSSRDGKDLNKEMKEKRDKEKDEKEKPPDNADLVLQPIHLLRLDATGAHSPAGEIVILSNFVCHGENLFLQVETTAPPPKKRSRKKRSFRKRVSADTLEVPHGKKLVHSAGSRDGGDEYSSEASEIDTQGTIPAWIKEELAVSEMDERENADTSEQSDDELTTNDTSMSSIQINNDLRPKHNHKSNNAVHKSASVPIMAPGSQKNTLSGGHMKGPKAKAHSDIGPIEFTPVDPLSSSSSSETMANSASPVEDKKELGPNKKVTSPPRKVPGPSPYKTKVGPMPVQPQKPLNRLRAQNKGRTRIQEQGAIAKEPPPQRGLVSDVTQKKREETLLLEFEKMKEEKRRTEERLRELEEKHRRDERQIKEIAEKQAKEREKELTNEIRNLRQELIQQSGKMQENYNVVLNLQEQLVKVQSDQMRMSAREQRANTKGANSRANSRNSLNNNKESKVCSIQ